MKYGPNLLKTIIKELEAVPNITYVFKKLGINRTTYYKWILAHKEFREQTEFALHKGRNVMNDIAESNIMRGVKNGSFAESRFWLTHNDVRYMSEDKHAHVWDMIRHQNNMNNNRSFKDVEYFESFFESYGMLKIVAGPEKAKEQMDDILLMTTNGDMELIEIFYACCEGWETEAENKEHYLDVVRQKAKDKGIDVDDLIRTRDSLREKEIEKATQEAKKKNADTLRLNSSSRHRFRGRSILR